MFTYVETNNSTNSPRKKVYLGMSGGVDSSVSAYLLKQAGYDVTGIFIKVWQPDWLDCNWKEERFDALRVAAHLGISFKTIDLEKEYKKEVVDYMIEEYKKGNTPNPDVMCNKYIKFGGFFDWAIKDGADFVATGHYAQVENGILKKAKDQNKDQTYFLWSLKKEHLLKTIFPIGGFLKSEVREIARKNKIPVAEKKDSQGLCFIGKIDIKDFLSRYIDKKQGDVLNLNGEVIGHHFGATFYTLGERHGFTITKKTPDDKPLFIVGKDIEKNTITVSENELDLTSNKIKINQVNFTVPIENKKYTCRTRYRETLIDCKIENDIVTFDQNHISTPGQSIVVYDGDFCIGGAVIDKVLL